MKLRILRMSAVVGLALGIALLSNTLSKAAPSLVVAAKRSSAPAFTLKDSSGRDVRLADYQGKVVLLNFWATWCGPCKAEIPWFVEFEKKYQNAGLVVVGVSMDEDGWKSVRPYMDTMHVSYRVLLADESVAAKYGGIESLPLTLLIDRQGLLAARHIGLTSKRNYEDDVLQLIHN